VQYSRERSDVLSKRLNPSFKPDREARERKIATIEGAKKAKEENEVLAARARAIEMEQATRLLMATGLPSSVSADELKLLFQQHAGLVEVRRVPGRDIAFIEYSSEVSQSGFLCHVHIYVWMDCWGLRVGLFGWVGCWQAFGIRLLAWLLAL
jgi:hypothetical protein